MKKIFFVSLFILCVYFSDPNETLAYSAIEQTTMRLNEDTFMFTITSRFLFMNYGLQMPIGAKRVSEYGKIFPDVGYAFYTENGELFTSGESHAIVLSEANIVGTEYVTEMNKAGYFTLVATVKLPKDTPKGTSLYMRTTTQPYTLTRLGKTISSQLDEKQLETYKTPLITI